MIEVVNKQRLARIPRRRISAIATAALKAISRDQASLTVALVRDEAIRRLNRDFRHKDSPTDVLSFPAEDCSDDDAQPSNDAAHSFSNGALHLGDIVISTDTAARQARETGHSFEREIEELVIHGVLHLCGYDHETDKGEMNRLELRLRRKLLD